jgi:CRP/FNR family transcriptional regulator, cyclic AMP receptor protein
MQRRSPMSGRKVRSSNAPRKGPAHPGRREVEPSIQAPPGCPSFLADPAFQVIASQHTYGRQATIVRQGDPVSYAYFLRRGLVQVSSVLESGKSFVDLMGPGSVFGIPWMLSGLPHGFALTAVAECDFDRVEAQRFLKYLEERPTAALEVLRHLCRQEIQLVGHLLQLSTRVPTGERLMSTLVELGRIYGVQAESGLRIPVPLTVQMLADKVGCSRQWASKALGELEAAGKLKRNRSWITLINGAGQPDRS